MKLKAYQEVAVGNGEEQLDEGLESVVQGIVSIETEDSKVDVTPTESSLCARWHTLYAPGLVNNKLFFLQSFLMVTVDGFCSYRGRPTGNIGLEKGDACGKLT